MPSIYEIKNTVTGKLYIGQTVDYEKRKASHINALKGNYHSNKYLQSSWNKYGESVFEFSLIVECGAEQLNELEIEYIRRFCTVVPNGYNMTLGGEGVRGFKWSEESRAKVSKSRTGKRVGVDASFYGKKHEAETLEKMRLATSGLWRDSAFRQRQVEAHTGKKQSEETKRKRSAALVGNTNNKRAYRYRCVETGIEYDSVGKIDLGFKVDRSAIYKACKRGGRAYGYHWQFVEAF